MKLKTQFNNNSECTLQPVMVVYIQYNDLASHAVYDRMG